MYEIDPNHDDTCMQLFLMGVTNADYKNIDKIVNTLINSDNIFIKRFAKLYLYLMCYIIELKEEHKNITKCLNYNDIRILNIDHRLKDIEEYNSIIKDILYGRLSDAYKKFLDLIDKHNQKFTFHDIILRSLMFQAINAKKLENDKLIKLIEQKNFEEVLNYLSKIRDVRNLSLEEKIVCQVIEKYKEIETTHTVPDAKPSNTNLPLELVLTNNFDKALNMYKDKKGIVYYALKSICSLIELQKQAIIEPTVSQSTTKLGKTQPTDTSFVTVLTLMLKNNKEGAIITLKEYLKAIEKSEYEFLLVDLIEISLLEEDSDFSKPMSVLSLIMRGEYEYDMSSYLRSFYIALANNEFKIARIYLDIISKSATECVMLDNLYQVLKTTESGTEEDLKDEDYEEKTEQEVITDAFDPKEFIQDKYQNLLENRGIILLDVMTEAKIDSIKAICKEYPNIDVFTIKDDHYNRVVLKYIDSSLEVNDVDELKKNAIANYRFGNYEECIRLNIEILSRAYYADSKIYAHIGLSYLKLKNRPLAIMYLTIANSLAKEENLERDYTDLLLSLKGKMTRKAYNFTLMMKKEKFNFDDSNESYENVKFEEVNSYIEKTGLSVDVACENLGLSTNETNLIKIIYAKELYASRLFKEGDKFLKSVEQSKEKSTQVKALLNEVRKNKLFYQNRSEEKKSTIVPNLTLKRKAQG